MLSQGMRVVTLSILVVSALALGACSKPYQKPQFDPDTTDFFGIEHALAQHGGASLITIHGMCHHTPTWFQNAYERLAERLQAPRPNGWEFVPGNTSKVVTALKTDIVRGDETLRMYGIIYSNATKPSKVANLCRDVNGGNAVCSQWQANHNRVRASFNNSLKNELLNDCLADAVIYLGETGLTIREGVASALNAIYVDMAQHADLQHAPVMYLSESLGSKILGDALVCAKPQITQRVYPELGRTSHLFLGANQVPLLNLGYRGPACPEVIRTERDDRPQQEGYQGLAELIVRAQRLKTGEAISPTVVVAFTDPNDLLSYEVDEKDFAGLDVVNVIVSNDWTWFGVFENPLKAHVDYRDNDTVSDLILCGRRGADDNNDCLPN